MLKTGWRVLLPVAVSTRFINTNNFVAEILRQFNDCRAMTASCLIHFLIFHQNKLFFAWRISCQMTVNNVRYRENIVFLFRNS